MGKILDGVLDEFAALAAIPRPSKHEQAVGKYLFERLKRLGLDATIDPSGNVIADLEPSSGCEEVPRMILQAHMDMVCVAEAGVEYNPLTDPIKLVRTEEYLSAEGTSLGADDGIGIALIISVLQSIVDEPTVKHGPIRVLLTVDEEAGMSGASALDRKYLGDAAFLINCDSENYEHLVIGSAGSVRVEFIRSLELARPLNARAFRLTVGGLKGGHSGEEINSGRANAIKLLAELLDSIDRIDKLELLSINGGSAINAIADRASAAFGTSLDETDLEPIVKKFLVETKKIYAETDPAIKIELNPIDPPSKTIADGERIIELLKELRSGVIKLSAPELVETSANIGVVSIDGARLSVKYFPRSSRNERLHEIIDDCRSLAERLNFELEVGSISGAWTENRGSRLARIMQSNFERQNGRAMTIKTIHAGLECSYFIEKNPALDIVSIGTTNEHIHSPNERLKLSTVELQFKLMRAALIDIAKNI